MTDKEKEAIKSCNLLLNGDITLHIIDDDGGTAYAGEVNKLYNEDLKTVLSLVQTQQEDIEDYQRILDTFDKREYRKRYLEEERAKRPGMLYPDADEVYQRYYEQKEEIEQLKMKLAESCARALNSDLKQKNKHEEDLEALNLGWKAEIEKKDTIINTMQAEFERLENLEDNTDMLKLELQNKEKECQKYHDTMMELIAEKNEKNLIIVEIAKAWKQDDIRGVNEIIQYFTNKVKKELENDN